MNLYKKVIFFLIINCSFHGWRSVVLLVVTIITRSSRVTSKVHGLRTFMVISYFSNGKSLDCYHISPFFLLSNLRQLVDKRHHFFYSASELGRIIDFIAKINFLPYAWFFFRRNSICIWQLIVIFYMDLKSCSWRLLWSIMKLILQNKCIPCRLQ